MTIAIGLGTVQLGLPYGNNRTGEVMPETEAHDIMREALDFGICFFDTAAAYGESETRIGNFLKRSPEIPGVEISTKIPATSESIWSDPNAYFEFVKRSIQASKDKLGVVQLGLLQFHQADVTFLSSKHVQKTMDTILSLGLCSSIGISVYHPEQALAALNIPFVSALQIPLNLIDRRFVERELLDVYESRKIKLIARSLLFQGLLVPEAPLPPVRRRDALERVRSLALSAASSCQDDLRTLSLRYILANLRELISIGLIGVDSIASLRANLGIFKLCQNPLSESDLGHFQQTVLFAREAGVLTPDQWDKS